MNRFSLLIVCQFLLIYLSRLPLAPKTQADLQKVSKSEVTTPSAEKIPQTGEFNSKEMCWRQWMRDYQDDNSVKTSEECSIDI